MTKRRNSEGDPADVVAEGEPAPETEAPSAPASEQRPAEDWATAKGYLPERFLPGRASVQAQRIEGDPRGALLVDARGLAGARENEEAWKFKAAKLRRSWAIGKMVTEAEFDAAIAEVTSPDNVSR